MIEKICIRCGESKSLSEYHERKDSQDGYRNDCKKCVNKRSSQRYRDHRDDVLAQMHEYHLSHRERRNAYSRNYGRSEIGLRKNRESHQRRKSEDPSTWRKKQNEYSRRYRETHPDREPAYLTVRESISTGRLAPESCEVCGSIPTEAHHDDYQRHIDVRWLCRTHHVALHARMRDVARERAE